MIINAHGLRVVAIDVVFEVYEVPASESPTIYTQSAFANVQHHTYTMQKFFVLVSTDSNPNHAHRSCTLQRVLRIPVLIFVQLL